MAHLILNLNAGWMWVVSLTPRPLLPPVRDPGRIEETFFNPVEFLNCVHAKIKSVALEHDAPLLPPPPPPPTWTSYTKMARNLRVICIVVINVPFVLSLNIFLGIVSV